MGNHENPPKWEEKPRRTQEKVRTWETVKRYVLENVTMNQSGGSIRQTRVRCWAMDMTHAYGIKGRKQTMPGKDGTLTVHELAALNKMS